MSSPCTVTVICDQPPPCGDQLTPCSEQCWHLRCPLPLLPPPPPQLRPAGDSTCLRPHGEAPAGCAPFSLCFLYIFLTNLHPPRSLNTRYSVTVSAGQKSRHGLAGSSAQGLKALHFQCWPGHTVICGPNWGRRRSLACCRHWQHPFLTGCRTEVPASLLAGPPLAPAPLHHHTRVTAASTRGAQSAVQESGGM